MEITLNNMRMKARWPREFLLPISVIKSSELRLCTCDLCTLFAFPHCGFNTMTQSHEPAAFNRILTLGRFPSPLQQNFGWEESNLSLLELLEHTHAAWRAHIIAFSTLVTHDPLFRVDVCEISLKTTGVRSWILPIISQQELQMRGSLKK